MLNSDALSQLKQLKKDIKSHKDLHKGTVKLVSNRFGFVTLDDGRDIYLPQEQAERVFPGDRIEINLVKGADGKSFAEVERLLDSALKTFVGRYQVRGKGHFAVPDLPTMGRWLFLPPKQRGEAKTGDLIRCRVTRHPFKSGNAQAEVVSVIGSPEEPGIERTYTLAKHELADEWPQAVLDEVGACSESDIEKLGEGRRDLRERPLVTIDAPSTQDMDDAVYAEPADNGWRVTVAIADPTALLPVDGPTEQSARERVSAGYFPGQSRPMLPEALSQQLASLQPQKPRLALVCEFDVHKDGSLGNYELYEALIESRAKLSYEAVAPFLEGQVDAEMKAQPEAVLNSLHHLGEASRHLRQWRQEHALVNADRPDYRLRLDENLKVRAIDKVWPTPAHKLIEECMVAANRCAADFLIQRNEPALFIVHRGIRAEKHDNIRTLLDDHGAELNEHDPTTPAGFARIVRSEASPEVPVRSIIMRQLERAELAPTAAPHHGMGLEAYTTFTSPLRKYTDFYVHRLIKHALEDKPYPKLDEQQLVQLQQGQVQLRMAVNEVEQWLKRQFAPQLADQDLEAQIVHILPAGFQVRLAETGIEGFVSTKDMPEKYSFDPVTLRLSSKSQTFQLDQEVTVRFDTVDQERQQIRFVLAN
ncbi:VacB/RNase II family 3'-5' exoribonuclease [Marinobacteraceae bacterium S3BR75-40.1]